jgi:hypothetical protein
MCDSAESINNKLLCFFFMEDSDEHNANANHRGFSKIAQFLK